MAKHDITTQIQELSTLGYDRSAIEKAVKDAGEVIVILSDGTGEAFGRKAEQVIDNLLARAHREAAARNSTNTEQRVEQRATPRQVDFIMSLLARRERTGEGGGFFTGPTDRESVARLTRTEASTYIDSLKGAY
jgi:hypothetical protein